jgi:hypothetical protein
MNVSTINLIGNDITTKWQGLPITKEKTMSKDKKTKDYNFGEKATEKVKDGDKWAELTVWQSPKFKQSREKAISLIEEEKYCLDEGDFWILMNKGGGKMVYTGLIISHNGCLKINDKLEDKMKFKPSAVSFLKDNGGDKVMQYICDEQGIYEFGEIAPANCKNQYPYAMVLKRLMDRVILKASKIGYFGIYSENESDDFKNKNEEPEEKSKNQFSGLAKKPKEEQEYITQEQGIKIEQLGKLAGISNERIYKSYGDSFLEIPASKFDEIIEKLQKIISKTKEVVSVNS